MLNYLYGYIENSLPGEGNLETRPGLADKVDEQGKMRPFFGNTVVFDLDDTTKAVIAQLQAALYQAAGNLLAEPLSPRTFHLTLHDLANGKPGPETENRMARTEPQARAILTRIRQENLPPIPMKATWSFNMVNTSIVLGAVPADRVGETRLEDMYDRFQRVAPLNYSLTPHITLAYFKPGRYTQAELEPLRRALGPVVLEFSLEMERLEVQNFTDMNHYMPIG